VAATNAYPEGSGKQPPAWLIAIAASAGGIPTLDAIVHGRQVG
jgi:hypothetical protein